MRIRHPQLAANPLKTKLAVGTGKAQRVRYRHGYARLIHPLVHAPEMTPPYVEVQVPFTNRATSGNCSVGPIGAANARRVVVGRLSPGVDVFQGLGQVKLLKCVVPSETWKPGRESFSRSRSESLAASARISGSRVV